MTFSKKEKGAEAPFFQFYVFGSLIAGKAEATEQQKQVLRVRDAISIDVRWAGVYRRQNAAAIIVIGVRVIILGTLVGAAGDCGSHQSSFADAEVVDPEFLSTNLELVYVSVQHKAAIEPRNLRAGRSCGDDRIALYLYLNTAHIHGSRSQLAVAVY